MLLPHYATATPLAAAYATAIAATAKHTGTHCHSYAITLAYRVNRSLLWPPRLPPRRREASYTRRCHITSRHTRYRHYVTGGCRATLDVTPRQCHASHAIDGARLPRHGHATRRPATPRITYANIDMPMPPQYNADVSAAPHAYCHATATLENQPRHE